MGRLLFGCLMATLVLLLSPAAFATTLVPMCGEHAETVAAPPPMRASSEAEITGPPCATPQELLEGSRAPARTPDGTAPLETGPRLPAIYHRLPRRSEGTVLRFADVPGAARSAFVRELDRPPR
jgi:hypothetical protein